MAFGMILIPENGNYNCEQGEKLLLRMKVSVASRGRTLLRVEKTKYRSRIVFLVPQQGFLEKVPKEKKTLSQKSKFRKISQKH